MGFTWARAMRTIRPARPLGRAAKKGSWADPTMARATRGGFRQVRKAGRAAGSLCYSWHDDKDFRRGIREQQGSAGFAHHRLAYQLGAALARRGAVVRCGGYGGVMEAVARGAVEAGGKVVRCTGVVRRDAHAVLGAQRSDRSCGPGRSDPEPPHRRAGGGGAARGVGTLNELFWVWTLMTHDRDDDPDALVLLGDHWNELLDLLDRRFEFGPDLRGLLKVAHDPEEAARIAGV